MCMSALCCASKNFCKECCSCCTVSIQKQFRIVYSVIFVLVTLFVLFLLHYFSTIMEWSAGQIECPDESGGKDVCLGASAVYRMSAVLFLLFTSVFIGCLLRNDCSKQYNEGAWTFKLIMIFFLFFLFFFINNSVFEGYIEFAKVISGIYMVF